MALGGVLKKKSDIQHWTRPGPVSGDESHAERPSWLKVREVLMDPYMLGRRYDRPDRSGKPNLELLETNKKRKKDMLRNASLLLTEKQLNVFYLKHVVGLSETRIAKFYKVSQFRVHSMLKRSLKKLRTSLLEEEHEK